MIRPHKRAIELNTFSIIKFKMLSVMEFYESADENIKIKNEINRNEKKNTLSLISPEINVAGLRDRGSNFCVPFNALLLCNFPKIVLAT